LYNEQRIANVKLGYFNLSKFNLR